MPTLTASEARANLYRLIDQTAESHQPVVIAGKNSSAVLVAAEDWQAIQETLHLLAVPGILGFDPRFQFIHEDDLAGCLEHAVRHDLEGVYNGAADGVLVLSEVRSAWPRPLAKRSTVTVTWGWRSANSRTARSASTMSHSIGVRGACGRSIASVKNAGSSRSAP